ncbi:MAG: serine/threonine-protein kinase [Gemmataceae bacterium]
MEPPLLPGYQMLRPLGGGKSFLVWAARDDNDNPVAVKVPRHAALDRASTLVLLRREVRAGELVQHPKLVRIIDSRLEDEPLHVVMEFVPGETAKDRIRRFGRFSPRRAIWMARQVAEALAALHAAGLVHADVKPGNVMVRESGEAKLIDLGFAHRPGENRKLIDAGFTIGTANYLAPELCILPVREGPAADIFALGATLFECLTGKVPYPADTVEEAFQQRKRRRPLDLADYRGPWPARTVDAVRAMLARVPEERPTAGEAARELLAIERELVETRKHRKVAGRRLAG